MPTFFFAMKELIFQENNLLFAGLNDITKQKDIHSTFEDADDSFLPSNPMDLINVLRSIESMNNSTTPSDAIDDALKAFDGQNSEDSSFDGGIK